LIHGVGMVELKKNADERGFFAELVRDDWKSFWRETTYYSSACPRVTPT